MNQIYSCSDFRSSLWSLAHTLGELHVRSHVAFLFTSHMIFQVHLKILEHVKVLTNTKGPSISSMVTLCDMFYDNQSSQIIDDVDNERNVHADLCCSYVLLFMLVICPPCLIYIYMTLIDGSFTWMVIAVKLIVFAFLENSIYTLTTCIIYPYNCTKYQF